MVFQNQKLDKDPSLEQTPNGRCGVVVDGAKLRSGTIEDVRGFSSYIFLPPSYCAVDLKRIEHLAKKNADRENTYSAFLQCNNNNFPTRRSIKPTVDDLLIIDETFME